MAQPSLFLLTGAHDGIISLTRIRTAHGGERVLRVPGPRRKARAGTLVLSSVSSKNCPYQGNGATRHAWFGSKPQGEQVHRRYKRKALPSPPARTGHPKKPARSLRFGHPPFSMLALTHRDVPELVAAVVNLLTSKLGRLPSGDPRSGKPPVPVEAFAATSDPRNCYLRSQFHCRTLVVQVCGDNPARDKY